MAKRHDECSLSEKKYDSLLSSVDTSRKETFPSSISRNARISLHQNVHDHILIHITPAHADMGIRPKEKTCKAVQARKETKETPSRPVGEAGIRRIRHISSELRRQCETLNYRATWHRVLTSGKFAPQQARPRASGQLLGDLISVLVGFVFQPSSVGKEHADADADNKNDAEHKDDTGVLAGPILSFDEEVKVVSLRSVDETNGRHGGWVVEG